MDSLSDNGLAFTYKVEGESLTMSNPTGQSYTAKLDGTEAPYKGDPGTTSVSVETIGQEHLGRNRQTRWESDHGLPHDGGGGRSEHDHRI